MGRSLVELSEHVGCLPSELYKKHDPTIGDFALIRVYRRILAEEQIELLKSMVGK